MDALEANSIPMSHGGLKIINASLFRMATKSMAQAYVILGYRAHHGLLEDVTDTPWELLEKAADATWPGIPGAIPRPPHKREDWAEIWGSYDVVTDIASPFAFELIKAYPEAKVVIVQRDFESWWPSFRSQLRDKVMGEPLSSIQAFVTSKILGIRPVHTMRKIVLGFCGAKTRSEINEDRVRKVYDRYFQRIREEVPQERRLEYKMGSGWEPLCDFLGVEVPNVPFPRANDAMAHENETQSRHIKFFVSAIKNIGPLALGIVVLIGAWWYSY
ncbi:hypothetical protein GGS24DRAFT_474505 [Hypoxylon argillaceum]|nr:hypothetical protein GGS24DRAFT_474505 [Hypoxylon argillaceum]